MTTAEREATHLAQLIIANDTIATVLSRTRCICLGMILHDEVVEFKAQHELELILFEQPLLHTVLVPFVVSRHYNEPVYVHATIEFLQLFEALNKS